MLWVNRASLDHCLGAQPRLGAGITRNSWYTMASMMEERLRPEMTRDLIDLEEAPKEVMCKLRQE